MKDALPLLAPVMRTLVGLPPGMLTELFLKELGECQMTKERMCSAGLDL